MTHNVMCTTLSLAEKGSLNDLKTFFTIAWEFWFKRNKMAHDKNCMELIQVIDHVLPVQKLHQQLEESKTIKDKLCYYWQNPSEGYFKLNVDGTLFFQQHKARVGVVRDEKGEVVMATSKGETETTNS